MLELNNIYNCDCLEGLKQMEDNSVDLTVTSPPYDSLRTYFDESKGECEWNFEVFKPIADELFRVTKKGGVVVWVVGDACVNGGETGSSFRQALYFQSIGFKIHDTMIYEKNSSSFPARLTSQRYTQIFEYMFIFSKGKIRNDIRLIADKKNKWAGWTNWGQHSQYDAEGNLVKTNNIKPIADFSLRNNIWKYSVSFNDKTGHPAVFPERLAEDHILSWSKEGDVVLDPFMGSGTTAKMAMTNKRNYIGFERNTGYWEESLRRVGKYNGKLNTNVSGVTWTDEVGAQGELQFVNEEDKETRGKEALWNELTAELREKFDTQSLGILKNLKVNLSYASKANDKRVQAVLEEKGLETPKEAYIELKVEEYPATFDECLKQAENDNCGLTLEEFEEMTKDVPMPTIDDCPYGNGILLEKSYKNREIPVKELTKPVLTKEDIIKICDSRIENYFKNLRTSHCSIDPGFYVEAPETPEEACSFASITPEVIRSAEAALGISEPIKKRRGRPKGSKNKSHKSKMLDYVPVLMPKTDDGGDYISGPRVKTDGGSGVGIEDLKLSEGENGEE